MTRAFPAAAAALVLLAAAVRLPGQSFRSFDEEAAAAESVRLRLGPLRLVPRFRLTEAGYDSNVYYRGEDGEAVADMTATLSPELRGFWPVGRAALLSFTENPEYVFYGREKGLRAFTHSFSAGLRLRLLRGLSLGGGYHADRHVRRVMSELDRRIRDSSAGGTAALFFETQRGTALGLTGRVDDFRYKDVASGAPDDIYGRALDRREVSAGLEIHYRVFSASRLFAVVEWTRYAFAHAESAWRDAEAVAVAGGLRFPLTGRARGTVRLGWKAFRPDAAGREPFAGLVAASEATVRLGRAAVTLGYGRDNAFSYIETAYYYIDSRARARLSLYVAPFLRLDAGVQLGAMTYPGPQTVWTGGGPVVVDRRRDDDRVFSAGPVVRLGGTAGLGLTFNVYARESNAPGFDIRRTFAGAFVTYEF
ncbi:MAG TPA: outer membrane beta-barrel protein [Candidatus Aminicenantes bacterium]|nr:outer membrane beta-barrel protein [Candidatus Aminicenantes bacterium]